MKFCLYITLAAALCCAACAPRQGGTATPSAEAAAMPPSPDAAMAQFIGTSFEGDSSTFTNTRLGSSATVTVGASYLSALGRPCKRAYCLDGGMRRSLAACQEENGTWALAPDIFERGAF